MGRRTSRIVENLDDTEADDLLAQLLERRPLAEVAAATEERTNLVSIAETVEDARELVENEGRIFGVRSGVKGFDELTMGMKGGDLIVVAGQTSHGKSLISLTVAVELAKQNIPVLFTTLEMSKARTTSRVMSMCKRDGIDAGGLPILYQEQTELSYKDIGMLVSRAKAEGCAVVVIDHLHFFPRGGTGNTAMEIGRITKHFKEVAVQHDIPIILISHVNRLSDPKLKPGLNNLKESGYIEQDADNVIFIWRDLTPEGDNRYVELYGGKSRNDGWPLGRVKVFHQEGWNLIEERTHDVVIPDFK
jgi:replicative DNA helicase